MAGATHDGQLAITTQELQAMAGKSWVAAHAWPAIRKFIVTKPLGAIGGAVVIRQEPDRLVLHVPSGWGDMAALPRARVDARQTAR